MRHIYALDEGTINILSGNVQRVAVEMGVSDKYIYAILGGTETDPFSKFKSIYSAAVRAGADVSHWDAALSEIKSRYARCNKSQVECLTDKINRNADSTAKMVEAIQDGVIDEREARSIRKAITKERDCLDALEGLLPVRSLANPVELAQFKNNGGR